VFIDGVMSPPLINEFGVPQGSSVGPLLYLLAVNSIRDFIKYTCVSDLDLVPFADDTTLCVPALDILTAKAHAEAALGKLKDYFALRGPRLNDTKSRAIVVSKSAKFSQFVKICGVKPQTSLELLGVPIDHSLKFDECMDEVEVNFRSRLKMLYRTSRYLSGHGSKTLFDTLLPPVFQ
jgi:hypothetical protein